MHFKVIDLLSIFAPLNVGVSQGMEVQTKVAELIINVSPGPHRELRLKWPERIEGDLGG